MTILKRKHSPLPRQNPPLEQREHLIESPKFLGRLIPNCDNRLYYSDGAVGTIIGHGNTFQIRIDSDPTEPNRRTNYAGGFESRCTCGDWHPNDGTSTPRGAQ